MPPSCLTLFLMELFSCARLVIASAERRRASGRARARGTLRSPGDGLLHGLRVAPVQRLEQRHHHSHRPLAGGFIQVVL